MFIQREQESQRSDNFKDYYLHSQTSVFPGPAKQRDASERVYLLSVHKCDKTRNQFDVSVSKQVVVDV